jgi:tetratricopeptide (TPR) repeat protein
MMKPHFANLPTTLISAILVAAAGGFYVLQELNFPTLLMSESWAAPQAAVVPVPATALELPVTAKQDGKPLAPIFEIEIVDPLLLVAWHSYQNGDFELALQYYKEVLQKDAKNHNPANRDALLGMAAIAQQHSQDAVAAQYYRQLLAIDPLDPDAQAGILSLLDAAAITSTESRLKQLLEQHPESAALNFALGNIYAKGSRWAEAQQAYFNACAVVSDNAQFAYNLAVSLDHLGQHKLAGQIYRRALQLDSNHHPSFDHTIIQLRLDQLPPDRS